MLLLFPLYSSSFIPPPAMRSIYRNPPGLPKPSAHHRFTAHQQIPQTFLPPPSGCILLLWQRLSGSGAWPALLARRRPLLRFFRRPRGARAAHRPAEQTSLAKVRASVLRPAPRVLAAVPPRHHRTIGDYAATPAPMTASGSRLVATGLAVLLISVSVGGFGGLLSFVGVLAGVSLVAVGVRVAEADEPVPVVFAGARALAAFLRRHHAVAGLVLASSAVTAVSGEAGPVLCFAMFALFLLGLCLVNIRALRGE